MQDLRSLPRQSGGRPRGITQRELVGNLESLPLTDTVAFSVEIRKLVERLSDPERQLRDVVQMKKCSEKARFAALYGWLLRLRREERFTEYAAAVRQYEHEFEHEPYLYTFHAIIAKNKGDTASLRSAVEYSRHAATLMPSVPGVIHQLAAFIVEYCERGESVEPAELQEAERAVDQAITLTHGNTSHYFETKARVLALRGEFVAARSFISQAIELEPRTSRDYQRRLTEYQTTKIRIDLLQQRSYWDKQQEENRRELLDFKSQQLQLLGLLAAIVAFVATTGNIASKSSWPDGLRLIEAMSGAIVVVFASFSLINSKSTWRVFFAYIIGFALLVVPYFVGK
jgi:tetratricopeptide (TPR) repeat protein